MILTGFQLRAAKISLNLDYNTLCNYSGVSRVTLGRLINTTDNFEEIKCSAQDAYKLYTCFCEMNLNFPNNYTISKNYKIEQKPTSNNLTKFQFIVARAALHLSQRDLATHITGVTRNLFQKFENKEDHSYFMSKKISAKDIVLFFTEKGIAFPNNKSVQIIKKETKII